jgi:hypothetical protein
MESETYLTYQESILLNNIRFSIKKLKLGTVDEMGLEWIHERQQYQIVDKKLWLLAKIKYGI